MYCLALKEDVFTANPITTLIFPTDISHLKPFRKTVEELFKWKDFLYETICTMKECLVEQRLSGVVRTSSTLTSITVPPSIFFTPKNNRVQSTVPMEEDGES